MKALLAGFVLSFITGGIIVTAGETNHAPASVPPDMLALSTNLYMEGLALQQANQDLDAAVAKWEAALQANPANADCLNHYAGYLSVSAPVARRNIAKGLELGLLAVKITEEKRPDHLDTVAEAYYQKGDYAQAVAYGRKAIQAQQQYYPNRWKKFLAGQQAKFEAALKEATAR